MGRARPSRPTGRRTSSATTASSTPSTRCSCPAPTTARGKRDARCRRGGLPPGRWFGGASRASCLLEDLSHAFARLCRALDVLDGADSLLDFLALLHGDGLLRRLMQFLDCLWVKPQVLL